MASRNDGGAAAAGRLMEFSFAYWSSQLVAHAAEMGLADRFGDASRQAADLASELGLHAISLHRFLRSLAGLGLFTETSPGAFALTETGAALRTGAPGAARSAIRSLIGGPFAEAWSDIGYSLRTGEPSFENQHGMGLFEYVQQNPGMAAMFSETMVGFHGTEPPAVAEAYDFSGIATLVDVGGASGNMLGNVLSRHPGLKGVLYDLPHVVTDAPPLLGRFGVADRVTIEGGSFFEGVPRGHDAYLLSHIIHDWDEQENATILGHCRDAMKPDGRILIVEMVLPEGDTPHPGKLLDMMMLLGPGGRERTPSEYAELLAASGLRLTRVVPTASAVSVVEAVRA